MSSLLHFLIASCLLWAMTWSSAAAQAANTSEVVSSTPVAESSDALIPIRPDVSNVPAQLSPEEQTRRLYLLLGYSAAIVLASMLGGYLPSKIQLTHTRMQLLMSFVGGLMLGVALFHLLLHAIRDTPSINLHIVMTGVALGILIMFLLLRTFHFHQHDVSEHSVVVEHADDEVASQLELPHDHDHDHSHGHHHHHGAHHHAGSPKSGRKFAWVGIAMGLGLHTVLDGAALAASCLRIPEDPSQGMLWGFATFLAILLHKPLDAISITSVMSSQGWSSSVCTAVNVSFAIMCPIGAALAWWGIVGGHSHTLIVSFLLAFSAGVFLCISLSDLLPEMQFHDHNKWGLSFTLLAGMGLAWGFMFLDPSNPSFF